MAMRYIGGGVGHCWRVGNTATSVEDCVTGVGPPDDNTNIEELCENEFEEYNDKELADELEIEANFNPNIMDEMLEEALECEEVDEDCSYESDVEEKETESENDVDHGKNGVDEEWDDLFGF
ncbi:hypothetical protein RhiJN_25845 [Ceratobasidium sp. AG-Ba]|nr:hypothetical protein RhiJN_25845 [Ceratobasidium sp. AG-Ba]